jgi:hypothetical protein
MMTILALIMLSVAALSGIFAVGNGKHWKFEFGDYFRGKRNAILYLWVITSTIFSILHSGMIVTYGISHNWGYTTEEAPTWMALHAFMGVLLTVAHLFVAYTLAMEVGPKDKFLWGRKHSVDQSVHG